MKNTIDAGTAPIELITEAQTVDAFSSSIEQENNHLKQELRIALMERDELVSMLSHKPIMVDKAIQASVPKPTKILLPNDIRCPDGPFTNLEYKRLYIDSEVRSSDGVIQRVVKTVPKKFAFEQTFIDTYYPARHPKYYNHYPVTTRHELRESKCCFVDCCNIS